MMRRHSIHPFAHAFRPGTAWGTTLVVLALLAPFVAQAQTPPCVNNVRCDATETASNGDFILIHSFAANCGDGVATIVITVNGGSHFVNAVPPGGTAEFDTVFVFSCTPGAQTVWTVTAVAQNAGGTSQSVSSTCSTTCAPPTNIGTLHCNDPNGKTMNIGNFVTIKGVVTELSFTDHAVWLYVYAGVVGI